jgi:hypothetical protein
MHLAGGVLQFAQRHLGCLQFIGNIIDRHWMRRREVLFRQRLWKRCDDAQALCQAPHGLEFFVEVP